MPVRYDYLRIIDDITARIASGELAGGQKLPPPPELAATYTVSVGTVRRALDLMKDRGILEGHQGKGVYVARSGGG